MIETLIQTDTDYACTFFRIIPGIWSNEAERDASVLVVKTATRFTLCTVRSIYRQELPQ